MHKGPLATLSNGAAGGDRVGAFGLVDAAEQGTSVCRTYFSTQDASGNYVTVSASTGSACDALFADGFEGCGN